MEKKGLSGIVSAMIMILLVIAMTLVVWGAIQVFFDKETLDNSKGCLDLSIGEQITLEQEVTCHNFLQEEMKFGINIGNVDVDEVIILFSTPEGTNSYTLGPSPNDNPTLLSFSREPGVVIPSKNSGRTFIVTGIKERPISIEIAPKINDRLCEISDKITKIRDCPS